MLDAKTIGFISEVTGKSTEEITTAITSESEVSLGDINGTYYTQEENELRNKTVRASGVEIGIKQAYKAAGIEFSDNEKNPESLVSKFQAHYSSNSQLQSDYDELKRQLDGKGATVKEYNELKSSYDTLKGTYEREKGELEGELNTIKTKQSQRDITNFIESTFPEKATLSREDLTAIAQSRYTVFKGEDGEFYAKKGGETVKGKTGEPKKAKDLYSTLWEGYIKQEDNGVGANKRKGQSGQKMSPEEAYKYIKETTDIAPTSDEGMKMFSELTKGSAA